MNNEFVENNEAAAELGNIGDVQGSDDSERIDPVSAAMHGPSADSSLRGPSGGPCTLQGRRKSSQNALKHGYFSHAVVRAHLHAGEKKAFAGLLAALTLELRPEGETERLLLEMLCSHALQFRRILLASLELRPSEGAGSAENALAIEKFQRCESYILRNFYRARAELERVQKIRLGEHVPHVVVDLNS